MSLQGLTAGGLATLACLAEVAAPKPGNVHRGADFDDTNFYDFQTSAVLLGQCIDQDNELSLGQLIFKCVQTNQDVVGKNTNLGIILLLCPLAMTISSGKVNSDSVGKVLAGLDSSDCDCVFRAIELANPGGLGASQEMDVANSPPSCLLTAMKAAEDRDLVARQYSRNFETVFEEVVPRLITAYKHHDLISAIVLTHVQLMAAFPDSLIGRKCGDAVAEKSRWLAQKCTDVQDSESEFWLRVKELDFWLRSDGNRRNPGTTADLIAAGLFVAFANGKLKP